MPIATKRELTMKIIRPLLIAISAIWFANAAVAQDAPPSLLGTWVTTKGELAHWEGSVKDHSGSVGTLTVEEQVGGAFRGTMHWDNDRSGPEFEGKAGEHHVQAETVVGVIDWDNETVYWVDHDDETTYRARLVDNNTMHMIALEPGAHAVAVRMIMVRKP